MKLPHLLFRLSASLVLGILLRFASPAQAQIVEDATLPRNSRVRSTGNTFVITEGTQRGGNLFHSFREFSVPTRGAASFQGVRPEIDNVLSRVTGSAVSNIDGLIEVLRADGTRSDANFFLLNPNGIIFGPNASLNIGGSFLATTANSINFADGTQFSATAPQTTPLLTVSVPTGLQFGSNPGRIINQSITQPQDRAGNPILDPSEGTPIKGLRVFPNRTLALVGGDIDMPGGGLVAGSEMTEPSGRIELGSVAGPGQVNLTPINEGWELGYEEIQNFGDVLLSEAATINANGVGGGSIQVQGRRVSLIGGSQIVAYTTGAQPGGTVTVNASEALLLRSSSSALSGIFTITTGAGRASNLDISTTQLSIQDGSSIVSFSDSNLDEGPSGNIRVRASDSVSVGGSLGRSSLSTETHAAGAARDMLISTPRLVVRDGAQVGSVATEDSTGRGGNVRVVAPELVAIIGGNISDPDLDNERRISLLVTQTQGSGEAGDLTIETNRLLVEDGGQVNTTSWSPFSTGIAGDLTIQAEDVELTGVLLDANGAPILSEEGLPFPSGLFSGVNPRSQGDGGVLRVETQRLRLSDGAVLQSATYGSGAAGDLIVRADDFIEVNGTSINNISPTGIIAYSGGIPDERDFESFLTATGAGGDIRITTGELIVRDGAVVATGSVNSTQEVEAGDLTIDAQTLTLDNQARLLANTNSGNGGNLILQIQDSILLQRGSQISTTSGIAGAGGNGGNIIIATDDLIATPDEDNDIIANAYTGQGGIIFINAANIDGFEEREAIPNNGTNNIDASSQFGEPGVVITDFSVPTELPSSISFSPELAQGCQVEGAVASAEFFNSGRGGVPITPYEPLGSSEVLDDVRFPEPDDRPINSTESLPSNAASPDRLVEAQGWIVDETGNVVLMAEVPNSQSATECSLR